MTYDRRALVAELRHVVRGEVDDRAETLQRYATDESIFSLVPSVVVCPKDETDLSAVVGVAGRMSVPVTARGGGTNTAGEAIGSGIILDMSRFMTRILDVSDDRAIVEPGVILGDLNEELFSRNRRFAPDPSSRTRCTIGGMAATNASGPHGYRYGSARDHIRRLRAVFADGSIANSTEVSSRFGDMAERLRRSPRPYEESRKSVTKNSSGYDLSALLTEPLDVTRLLVGSEGTLALFSEIEISLLPRAEALRTGVFAFPSLREAVAAVSEIEATSPVSIELVDRYILDALRGVDAAFLDGVGLKECDASLWVEWEGIPRHNPPGGIVIFSPAEQKHLWWLRSEASRALQCFTGSRRSVRCIEDGVVPKLRLGEYIGELRELLRRHDCDGAIFGHAGDAHIHVNPRIDITQPNLSARIELLMEEAFQLVRRYGGTISGEHGDGMLRSRFVARQWPELWPLFVEIKNRFDPKGILNPGKKIAVSEDAWPAFQFDPKQVRSEPNCLVRSA